MLLKLSQKKYSVARSAGIVQYLSGDLTSTTSFKGEVYPLVVLENSVGNDQKLTTLMSSSGRITYTASNFLRFWQPEFIQDLTMLESKDRLQGRLRTFSKEMIGVFMENKENFKEATRGLFKESEFVYEEDLFRHIFSGKEREEFTEGAFAVHKYLFEASDLIKDGQWSVTEKSYGPYILRPNWQRELLSETKESLKYKNDLELFQTKVADCLKTSKPLKMKTNLDSLLMKCLKTFSEEFYVNVIGTMKKNPFLEIIDEALLGVAIVDSQAQAKALLKILTVGMENNFDYTSKPLSNSFVNSRLIHESKFNILPESKRCKIHDFGDIPVYLIDPIGTSEVDDGISVERIHGNDKEVILHVHVADPSCVVSGEVENEARRRAESLYLAERKIPMLPEELTKATSLTKGTSLNNSGVKTLSFTCRIDLDTGQINDHAIRTGIINNLKHFTYEEAEMIVNDPNLELIKQIAKAHLRCRSDQGHLDISFPKGVARIGKDKKELFVDIQEMEKGSMKNVVAEAMIIAGRIAGEYLKERGVEAPFRNHALSKDFSQARMNSLLEKYEILKQMIGASVDLVPKRHESMGLDTYVKVTSPLRRYLDLVTHRILKEDDQLIFSRVILNDVHRQEVYNKKLGMSVNRFWIEKFIWQEQSKNEDVLWTLIPLERSKERIFTVHIEEVASNFMVQIAAGMDALLLDLGEPFKARLIGKPHESILRFERVHH